LGLRCNTYTHTCFYQLEFWGFVVMLAPIFTFTIGILGFDCNTCTCTYFYQLGFWGLVTILAFNTNIIIILVFLHFTLLQGCSYPSFTFQKFQDANIWNISKLHGHFILPSMAYPRPSCQVLVWKRGLVGFWIWMEWDFGILSMIEGSRTNSCTKKIYNSINIHHWTKTQNSIHTWLL